MLTFCASEVRVKCGSFAVRSEVNMYFSCLPALPSSLKILDAISFVSHCLPSYHTSSLFSVRHSSRFLINASNL